MNPYHDELGRFASGPGPGGRVAKAGMEGRLSQKDSAKALSHLKRIEGINKIETSGDRLLPGEVIAFKESFRALKRMDAAINGVSGRGSSKWADRNGIDNVTNPISEFWNKNKPITGR